MRILILSLCLSLSLFATAQEKIRHDSAIIVFKNVSTDTLAYIHAVIKGQFMFVDSLKPNEEYQHKLCTNCPGIHNDVQKAIEYYPDTLIYRFHVVTINGGGDEIVPMDYFGQVSNENITTGTYIYYIGWSKDTNDSGLDIKLKKLK